MTKQMTKAQLVDENIRLRAQCAVLEAKIAARPLKAKETPTRVSADAIDLVKILQESLANSGAKKQKAKAAGGNAQQRTTATLVKKKRVKGAL